MSERKVAFVTGASRGIGRACAISLAQAGYDVAVSARTLTDGSARLDDGVTPVPGGLDTTVEKIIKAGQEGLAIEMDLMDRKSVLNAADTAYDHFGRIDVLLNNAGLGVYGAIEDVSMEDIYYQYDVNLFGLARVTKAVLPYMREKESGLIINISSVLGETYGPLAGWYLSTKHALEGWSDALRVELKEFDIDVVVVQPGAINTNFSNVTKTYIDKYRENSAYQHLYGEPITDTGNDVLSNQSDPIVIAKVINKAMNARNPKTRYAAGAYSKIGIFLRKIMTDKMFDRFILFISD